MRAHARAEGSSSTPYAAVPDADVGTEAAARDVKIAPTSAKRFDGRWLVLAAVSVAALVGAANAVTAGFRPWSSPSTSDRPSTSKQLLGPAPAAVELSSAAWSTPPEPGLSEKDIVYREDFANGCPFYTAGLTEDECRRLPDLFPGTLHEPFVIKTAEDPQGCFSLFNMFYYNSHPFGGGTRPRRKLYCRRSSKLMQYQKLTSGTCSEHGYSSIEDEAACEAAAKELALSTSTVQVTNDTDRPRGCYFFKNFKDVTATLWLSTNPANVDVGVQASDPPGDFVREPLCVEAQDNYGSRPDVKAAPAAAAKGSPRGAQQLTPTVHVDLPGAVVITDGIHNMCPSGTRPLTEAECRQLPENQFRPDAKVHRPFAMEMPEDPKGCFFFLNWYYYNVHKTGQGRSRRNVFCMRHDMISMSSGDMQGSQGSVEMMATTTEDEREDVRAHV